MCIRDRNIPRIILQCRQLLIMQKNQEQECKMCIRDRRTDVTIAVVFSWQKEAKVTVKNVVQDIKAKVLSAEGSFTPVDSFIESGIYTVTLIKTDEGNWMVGDIELEEEVTPEIVNPIPTPAPAETDTSEDEGGDEEEGAVPEDTESPTPEE